MNVHEAKNSQATNTVSQDNKTTYRYVKLVNGNYEMTSFDLAERLGEYEIDSSGLPQHVRDVPFGSVPEFLIEGLE